MNFWSSLAQPILGLAPMDGVTDATFRGLVAQQGRPDVVFTEFTHVNDICRGPALVLSSLIYSEGERPIVAQLYGKDPDLFYIAAHAVCELGFDGLDINMGCPSRNVASSGSGAGLIKTPELAGAIMRAARQGILDWAAGQSPLSAGLKAPRTEWLRSMNLRRNGMSDSPRRTIPLSVKTRLGYDSVMIEQWISHLLRNQPSVISIHGRTFQQMYRGQADWAAITRAADIVRETATLLLGNGDVQTMGDAVQRIWESRVHGVLIGRGALGAPWFFRHKERARAVARSQERMGIQTSLDALDEEVAPAERFHVMIEHARQFEALCGQDQFRRMRKHLGWYCKGFPYAASMRARMFQAACMADVERILASQECNAFSCSLPASPLPVC
ncbi:MAG: tRNA dihydrouridine synthase [Nitrospiraceae bacterium]